MPSELQARFSSPHEPNSLPCATCPGSSRTVIVPVLRSLFPRCHFAAILLTWKCSRTRNESEVRTKNSNCKPARALWAARLRATKTQSKEPGFSPDAPGSAGREAEQSPQAQVVSLDREVDNLLAMRTSTEFEPNLRRTVIRRIRAHARPSASAKLTRFYSTMKPSRNRRNSLKTNNRCTLYSTINRGGAAAHFPAQNPASSLSLREKRWDAFSPNFLPVALKTNESDPHRAGQFLKDRSRVQRKSPAGNHKSRHSKCHTMPGRFRRISLKTNVRYPREVTHNFGVPRHV
jgi:hypothetical protein